jgi:DNA-binding transcriptional regulator YbjK
VAAPASRPPRRRSAPAGDARSDRPSGRRAEASGDAPSDRPSGRRAEASERLREAIVRATVRLVARDGVASVTHRRVAAEAEVSLSSTTWHFATKADILAAALQWTARREVARITEIAARLDGRAFSAQAWADELADWLAEQVEEERDVAVALYRLQIELLGRPEVAALHREWEEGLRALGAGVLGGAPTATPELDTQLVVATLDGLRLAQLSGSDPAPLRPAIARLLEALFGR